ncbi:dynamin central region family protein (macronuclear) [Tetrahymena thermophila SB210]|uniref:Dynamin central region family protein n=1 Tax=Tetrahymena thermophila (strain SB210) TaxID=312017 RepID=I7M1G8_TETTS|nr:dynamin central region family protein [Tetrahymena thermophila SB210]EAR96322.2 dynamin central region family protein [Tetrahymena thermophila SB210]|eukprot:XP_001016567.2 dynamin central region family protein [Tetrahymena thermophila SB210]
MASEQSTLVTNLRKFVTLVDRLRDTGLHKYIDLPRIAVLGSQSAGKSSLLEQIVGLDFLPRGEGTVTRRPLEMRLFYVPKEKLSMPYGVFEEIPGQKFTDFQMVKQNIDKLTNNVAGANKGIVDKPIVLTIYSSTCPDLTIVDLPGITKIPIRGTDQTQDIEKITKEMAARYCKDPKTIILCVIPANADITTSDGLMMARQLDPQGSRTIGCITKIDIMDKGTDARRLLTGEDVGLKLGYVGIKNRSQADINEKKTVLQSLDDERKFFSTSPIYSSLPSSLLGTRSLTNKLTDVLYTHIRTCLPQIISEIQKQINEKEQRLKELGTGMPEEEKDKLKYLWKVINDFSTAFKNSINGSYDKLATFDKNKLPAGHRIRVILTDLYSDIRSFKPTEQYSDIDIKNAIIKHEGDSIPGFPSIDAFLALLTPLLQKLKDPAFECVNEVYHVLEEIATNILDKIVSKVPALKEELQDNILQHFKNERDSCRDKIESLIDSEIGYIFTNDVEYLTSRASSSVKDNPPIDPKQPIPKNNQGQGNQAPFSQNYQRQSGDPLVHELRYRLDDYFSLVMRGIRDSVPKFIGYFLVKASQFKLQQTLFEATNRSEKYFNLMAEPTHIVEERKNLASAVETLKTSIKMIRRDPDFSSYEKYAKPANDVQKERDIALSSSSGKKNNGPAQPPPPRHQNSANNSMTDIKPNQTGAPQNPNNSFSGSNQNQQNQNRGAIFPPGQQQRPVANPLGNPNPQQGVPQQVNPVGTKPNTGNAFVIGNQPNNPNQNNNNSNPNLNNNSNNNVNQQPKTMNLFGNKPIPNQGGQVPPGGQPVNQGGNQPPVQQPPMTHQIVDKAVDKTFENPQFQKGLQNAASAGAKQAFGNNAIGEAAGKGAAQLVQNQAVQDAMKDQAKQQGKAQADQKATEAKASFKFW